MKKHYIMSLAFLGSLGFFASANATINEERLTVLLNSGTGIERNLAAFQTDLSEAKKGSPSQVLTVLRKAENAHYGEGTYAMDSNTGTILVSQDTSTLAGTSLLAMVDDEGNYPMAEVFKTGNSAGGVVVVRQGIRGPKQPRGLIVHRVFKARDGFIVGNRQSIPTNGEFSTMENVQVERDKLLK